MNLRKYFLLGFVLLLNLSCSPRWQIMESSSTKIALDSKTEETADQSYIEFLAPYKAQIDSELNVVIGQAEQVLDVGHPESLLGNFAADAIRNAASKYLNQPIDIGITNVGGLRVQLPKGDITLRNVLELMPFENELVILWIRGDTLAKVLDEIAAVGGECVSGINMGIKERKVVDVTIGGKSLDSNKLYSIATSDFLAGGNDKIYHLAKYEKRENTGLKLRDVFNDTIKEASKRNQKINSQIEGRIYEIR